MDIDTSFDVGTDAGGKDPDKHNPTLKCDMDRRSTT